MVVINYLFLILPVLINVAFITLMERKFLGYIQMRKGPNKVSLAGVLQPFNDAIKLFSKESILPRSANLNLYTLSPAVALLLVLFLFSTSPSKEYFFPLSGGVMLMYTMMSMNIYPLFISGWASNSKYALIGALRAIAQTISYEVSLAAILMFYLGLSMTFSLSELSEMNQFWAKLLISPPLAGIWIISCLAETNRTPFDFAEGESELVSGFNVEYGGVGFALNFMAEYASILFLSAFTSFFFFTLSFKGISFYISTATLISIWIWIRATFPRYRYDKLMNFAWKVYLPVSLVSLVYMLVVWMMSLKEFLS